MLKTGRTHLQDAVPDHARPGIQRLCGERPPRGRRAGPRLVGLHELNLGATALGTGLNAGDDFTQASITNLVRATGLAMKPARNRFRVTQSMGDVLTYSGGLRRLAVEVDKVASDLRLLSSGPRAGIAEILLPAVQPGSSIMPGKVNPSVPEMVNQVCQQVWGCDADDPRRLRRRAARAERDDAGHRLERAARLHDPPQRHDGVRPTAASRASRPTRRAAASCSIAAPRSRRRSARTSATPQTADIAKTAVKTGRSIADIVRERKLIPEDKLAEILSPEGDDVTGDSRDGARRHETVPGDGVLVGLALLTRAAGGAARAPLSARGSRPARRSGSRRLPAPGPDHGRAPDRRRQHRSRTWAPAADGSRCGWRGASARTAASTPRTSSRR